MLGAEVMSESKTPPTVFDEILEHKIGYGKYQRIMYVVLGFIYLADGSELIALSLILPILHVSWGITEFQQTLMGTILFFGVFLGGLSVGVVADRHGRQKSLLWASLIQFIVGILSAFVSNIPLFIILRGMFGFMIGFTWPLAPSIISEVTPIQERGVGLLFGNLLYTFGKVFGCLVAWVTLNDLTSGNWQLMLILCSFPALFVCIGCKYFLLESPRYFLALGKVDEAVTVLNQMGRANKGDEYIGITEQERLNLSEMSRVLYDKEEVANVKTLFTPKYRQITISLWIMWFCVNFIFYGMIFILPYMLIVIDSEKGYSGVSGLAGLLITILGEFPSILLCLVIVENKSFGRKNSSTIGFLGGFVCLFISVFININYFVEVLSAARFFLKMGSAMLNPLTAEMYHTSIRAAGVGFSVAIGRGGNTLMPTICMLAFDWHLYAPMYIFMGLALIAALASHLLPYDTLGRALDLDDDKKKELMQETDTGNVYFEMGKTNDGLGRTLIKT